MLRYRIIAAAIVIVSSTAAAPIAAGAQERPYLRPMDGPDGPGRDPMTSPEDGVPQAPYVPAARQPAADAPGRTPRADRNASGPKTAGQNQPSTTLDAIPAPVDRGELAPVMAGDGSGLPMELWSGLDVTGFEKLISEIEIPPRSAALHALWKRLITSNATPPSGDGAGDKFAALRLEALYRSGLASEAAAEIAKQQRGANNPVMTLFAARGELANAAKDRACDIGRQASLTKGDIPKPVKIEAMLLNGYCAAVAEDKGGAGLAAELAREEGAPPSAALDALDAISIGAKPKVAALKHVSLLDYRLLELAGAAPADALDRMEPALLAALTNDPHSAAGLRLDAAESAARLNAVSPDGLAAIYAALGAAEPADALLTGSTTSGPARRAALFKAIEAEKTPMKTTRLVRALIDDARRNGLAIQAMQMSARAVARIPAAQELSWFAETAAEVGLASANYDLARRWIELSGSAPGAGSSSMHWMALIDIADPGMQPHGQYLGELETLALRARFTPDQLHRLATVLDALDYVVPIPLWDAASRTPQPATGYLPETGVLSQLQDASKKKEFGRTVLLAMKALGPSGAEGAHMIALGDSIRALKRAGLEPDARRLGLEALLGSWPRMATN